jgi:SWI/SNF-related matrix-associated actin-dependent regulator of chromatin subfamily A-like protein 1
MSASTSTNTGTGSSGAAGATMRAGRIAERLFPHQVEGVAFLLKRRRAILADDMGLGKTRQAIIGLHVGEPGGPYLVICPASVKRNWAREIDIALPGAAVQVIAGKSDGAPLTATWVVVNYDILAAHAERLAAHPWRGIVFDEAHYIRNHSSQRSRQSRAVVDAARDPLVYALTGTPLTNRPRDLFPLLQLCGHPLAKSFLSFAKRYCDAARNEYGWQTDGASNLDELAVQLHGVMLRRSKDDVLELPPKLRTWLEVDVPANTGGREIAGVVRMLVARQTGAPRAAGGDAADRMRLLAQLSTARLKLAAAKTAHTIEFVENAVAQGGKVIVFSCFDDPVNKVKAHFGDAAVLLNGATPTAQRQARVDRFQNDDGVRVFVANIVAGGIGLNLTAARHVVFNDLDWVPANHWQAEDRAYRIGQAGTVHVTYMVAAGTVDDFVSTLLAAKAALVGAVVDGRALDAAVAGGGVLDELQRLLRALSPHMADTRLEDLHEDDVASLLRQAAATAAQERDAASATATDAREPRGESDAMKHALRLLEQALTPPSTAKYRVQSNSRPGDSYVLEVDAAGDVACDCPGFGYRGQCSHARTLKSALGKGQAAPAAYVPVAAGRAPA